MRISLLFFLIWNIVEAEIRKSKQYYQFGNKIQVFLQGNESQLFREGEKCDENLA